MSDAEERKYEEHSIRHLRQENKLLCFLRTKITDKRDKEKLFRIRKVKEYTAQPQYLDISSSDGSQTPGGILEKRGLTKGALIGHACNPHGQIVRLRLG